MTNEVAVRYNETIFYSLLSFYLPLQDRSKSKFQMTSPSAFISIDRQHAIASDRALPDRAFGAALFADISGFTPLTEELAHAFGPERGAEELVAQLNEIYDALIAEVDLYGGSVIGFSGDAVTCWFDGDNGQRATASALAIQNAMQKFATVEIPRNGAVSITVKVAVATGSVRRLIVGDPSIQLIDVLAGKTLDTLDAAGGLADKGQVILDEAAWSSVASIARLEGWRSRDGSRYAIVSGLSAPVAPQPWQPLAPNTLRDDQVRPWVLAPIYERLVRGQSRFLAELRPAIALFLNFKGIDYDNDDRAGEKLDTFVRRVQRILERLEGTLIAITFGDKGSYMNITLGAPIAHDDDAERAIAAALELRELGSTLGFIESIKMGLSRGHMRTGAYGSTDRLAYGVQGDEVNLAARLMQRAAPGQILLSERMATSVRSLYRLNPLGKVQIKGRQDQVGIFEVVEKIEIKRLPADASEMVGREAERAVLIEQLTALRGSKTSSVVLIEGEAGIGKSRLVEYLRYEAQLALVTLLTGAGDATERTTPYHAWRSVFAQLFKLDALPQDKETRRAHVQSQVKSAVGSELARFTPLLGAVLPLEFQDNELTAQMYGQVRADNTQLLLTGLLQHVASAWPLLLVLEDAHWFDSASWALARRVAQVNPILQVIALRPLAEPVPMEYRNLLTEPGTIHFRLVPLPPQEVQTLVSRSLGVKSLPSTVAKLLRDKAEGNPFFSQELAYALRDSGLLAIHNGQAQIAPNVDLNAVAFPDTVQDVVTSRIDRLTASQQLTLKVASVIGRLFAYQILYDNFPIDSDRPLLHDQLEILSQLDFTTEQAPEPELAYGFKQVITQDVAYGLLLFAQRRELHQHLAEWYERCRAQDLSPYYALLAYHWERAEVAARAIDYLEKAGEQALRNFANEEAASFFDRALNLAQDAEPEIKPIRRAMWELQAGEAYVNLSRYIEGRKHIQAGLALAGKPVPEGMTAEGLDALGQVGRQIAHRALAGRYVNRSAAGQDEKLKTIRAYERLAEATYFLGETMLPVYAALRGLNLAEVTGSSPELGRSSAAVGAILGFIPLHNLAEGYLQRATKMVQAYEDLESREYVSMTASYYYSGVGNWEQVREQAGQVLEIAHRLGDTRRWEDVTSHLVSMHYFQANFAESTRLADLLHATAAKRNDARFIALALQAKAYCDVYSGDLDRAMTSLTELRELVGAGDEVTVLPLKIELLGLEALAHLRRGDSNAALDAAAQALALTEKATPSFYAAISGYTGPALVYLDLWEHKDHTSELAKRANRAVRSLGKYSRVFPIGKPRFSLYQGRYAWLMNNPRRARQKWQESLALATSLEMPYEQGLAHYEIARGAAAGDAGRQQHRERAIEIFSHVGAAFDLERARKL